MPFFSIIIPVYKVEKYLEQCVESVIAQTFSEFEIILVDDGSPDQSPQICDGYAKRDKRVKVIHKKNGGASEARNEGLNCAIGQYIIFLDSDDYWNTNDALRKVYDIIDETDTDIVIFRNIKYYQMVDKYSENIRLRIEKAFDKKLSIMEMMKKNVYIASSCDKVVRRKFIEENKMRFVMGQVCEDIEWCIKLLLFNPSIEVLDEDIYVYRQQNTTSVTANISRKNIVDFSGVLIKYLSNKEIEDKESVMNFLAEEYVLWLTCSTVVDKNQISDLLNEMKKYWYILNYDWYPYVQTVGKVRWLGFGIVRRLLGIYLKMKRGK